MPTLTDAGAAAALNGMSTLYAQIHTADPTDAGTAAVSTQFTTRLSAHLATATARSRSNDTEIRWPTPATASSTITHVSLWSAATGGVCHWRGPLNASVPVAVGEVFRIVIGDLVISLP